jgi:hypothetical protein
MPKILIHMTFPLIAERVVAVSALQFSHWFPLNSEDSVIVNYDSEICEAYFDFKCIDNINISKENIKNHVNVMARHIYVRYTSSDLTTEFIDFIKNKDYGRPPLPELREFDEQYKDLSHRVYLNSVKVVNSIIDYIRDVKGQFWVTRLRDDTQDVQSKMITIKARFKSVNEEMFYRFCPVFGEPIEIEVDTSIDNLVSEEDWKKIKDFIISNRRTPGYAQILSAAHLLNAFGYPRPALSEAVSALEICFNRLWQSGDNEKLKYIMNDSSVDFKRHCEHLGFSASFDVLLPLIFKKEEFDTRDLQVCYQAIMMRNEVLHAARKRFDSRKISMALRTITKICNKFHSLAVSEG